jgi:hypothetical protein
VNWAVAAVVLGMAASAGVAGEPKVLSELELETVTAAGVLIDVNSVAAVLGHSARAFTDANTTALVGKSLDLGIGLTMGQAFACCGQNTTAAVDSAVLGVGDIVHSGKRILQYNNALTAHGLSAGFVVAVSYKEPQTMVQELRPALMGVRSEVTAN